MDVWKLIFVSQEAKLLMTVLIVTETAPLHAEILKFCATVKSFMVEKRRDVLLQILANKRQEMSMDNIAQITPTPTNAQLPALMIPINAQPELTQITAKNKPPAHHAQRTLTMNAAHLLQIAQLFANHMKRNAKNPVKMKTDAHYHQPALFKNVITMANFAQSTVQENVMMDKSNAQEKETTLAVKDQTSVYHCPRNCGVMM